MSNLFKSKGYLICIFLFVISILPFLGKLSSDEENREITKDELYLPELSSLNSVEKTIQYIDNKYASYNLTGFDTAGYVRAASYVIKRRFYRGVSHYKLSDNWIAFLCGKFLWSHMSAIIKPDDILKHPSGLCSQQTIVFMEILKRKHINVRSVGLGYDEGPGHFLCEVNYNNSWRLYDVTFEPKWSNIANRHESMKYYLGNKDSLYLVYQSRMKKDMFDKVMERVDYGKVNEFPANHMLIFHQVTLMIVYILPLFFLSMAVGLYSRRQKKTIVHNLTPNSISDLIPEQEQEMSIN